jgi:hypothetical protein
MASDPPLLALVPPIRRARGCRLYDVRGRRYLDLFRDGALLGHREAGTLTAMKAVLSQGLVSALPSVWERRLLGALGRLFPGYPEVRLYASPDRARSAVRAWLGSDAPTEAEVHDPARDGRPGGGPGGSAAAAYWRPFLPTPAARALLPVLPVRVGGCPSPVCFSAEVPPRVPRSDAIPGFILAGALRGLAALGSLKPAGSCPLSTPVLDRALDAAPGWLRVGPYVTALFDEPDYARVHEEFLRAGVLLSPCCPGPSVLPGECSPGESRLLAELFTGIPGG